MATQIRQADYVEQSAEPVASLPIQSAAIAETHLVRQSREVDLNDNNKSAKEALQRWLSMRSVISTTSSNAIKQQGAALDAEKQVFRSIGKGFCAEIFQQADTGRVLKRAFNPQNLQLWNDYVSHQGIYQAIADSIGQELNINIHVPKVFSYITRDSQSWWDQYRDKWPSAALREPTDLLNAELILPLPQTIRESLIAHYCAPHEHAAALADPKNRDCLIRVYLGVRRPNRTFPSNFSLRNFEADLEIVDELQLEKVHHAQAMAVCLAEMHWTVGTDAADVEFVLGRAPEKWEPKFAELKTLPPRTETQSDLNFQRGPVHMWLLDFNQCKPISMDEAGVKQAIAAFWQNDPYYPRPCPPDHPDEELWTIFKTRYLQHSDEKAESRQILARQFIDGVVAEAIRRASTATTGPPRGQPSARGPPRDPVLVVGNPPSGGLPPGGGSSSSDTSAGWEDPVLTSGRGGRRRGRGGLGRGGQGSNPRSSLNIEDLI